MANNKVNFLRGTSAEYEASTKDNDTFYYTTDTKKLYLGENEVGNGIDPKVIQAHIDNQTIHAKVWRGTQEEYNAIEPKEDDTVYIIKDSDNTLADKLIDDTSTTATDKTWSAKKINENDEVARAAINAHSGNAEIHVTAEEKATWNAVNYSNPNLLINPDSRINQRGKTEYTSSGYTVDRWSMTSGAMKVSINDAGNLVISRTASGGYPMFGQSTEQKIRAGEFYTYSIRYKSSSGLFKAGLAFINSSGETTSTKINRTGWFSTDGEWHTVSIKAEVPEGYTSGIYVYIHDLAGNAGTVDDAVELEYSKLEIGSVATPFCPPDPATELARCQRYYQIRSTGDIAPVDLRPTMRDTPTITQLSDGNYAYSAEL